MPKGRILAVDDQRYFRELLEGMLTEEGFEVVTVPSGEDALHALEHSNFDIVLTDLVMPRMDGSDLVHRIKERDSEQDIVVITGVVDVKTAVEAMKLGAAEYLLKPFDRATLAASLEKILQTRRLKNEHARLLAENIEYMGERTLFERAAGFFSCLAVDPLAARIVEALCVETRAQGGIVWIEEEEHSDRFHLTAVRGLVRVDEERDTLSPADLPAALLDGSANSLICPLRDGDGEARLALHFALHRDGRVIGLVRLTDKLGEDDFDAVDQACGEKLLGFGEIALANALRFSSLEKRSLEDPATGAYIFEYFQDVVRTEIEKSNRFGRSFSLFKVDLSPLDDLRRQAGDRDFRAWLAEIAKLLQGGMRSADVLAEDGEGRFVVLLPETDALGGAVFKQRALQELNGTELVTELAAEVRPEPHLAVVTYPSDGTQLESLLQVLDERVDEERHSPVRRLGLERRSLTDSLKVLLGEGAIERPETATSIARFLLSEVRRQSGSRGLLFVAPGTALAYAVTAGLEELEGTPSSMEVVVIADQPRPEALSQTAVWLSPPPGPSLLPFLVHYGDGAVYALVRDDKTNGDAARLFHTDDRSVVEHLAFRLQRELALPALI